MNLAVITNITAKQELTNFVGNVEVNRVMICIAAVVAFTVSVTGVVGNLFTIFAFTSSRRTKYCSTAFVVNMSIVELLFCLVILPVCVAHYVYFILYEGPLLDDASCSPLATVGYLLAEAELQSILAITIIRAIAVTSSSLYAMVNTATATKIYIFIIWAYSTIGEIPSGLGIWDKHGYSKIMLRCGYKDDDKESQAIRGMIFIYNSYIPIGLIILLYIYTLIRVKLRASVTDELPMSSLSPRPPNYTENATSTTDKVCKMFNFRRKKSSEIEMRLLRSIIIVFSMTLISVIPIATVNGLQIKGHQLSSYWFLATEMFYWLPYCLNIVVYFKTNENYAHAYRELYKKIFPEGR